MSMLKLTTYMSTDPIFKIVNRSTHNYDTKEITTKLRITYEGFMRGVNYAYPPSDDAPDFQKAINELMDLMDHVLYDVWERQGYILTTEGNVIHYGFIERFIEQLGEKYHIIEIAYDRWNATQMVQNLEDMGFTMVPFGQGFNV